MEEHIDPSWIVAQIGAREHYAVPRALARRGQLGILFTDLWSGGASEWLHRLPGPFRSIGSRFHSELEGEDVVAFSTSAVWNSLTSPLRRRLQPSFTTLDEYISVGAAFARRVRNHLAKTRTISAPSAYFGYNTGCLETLELLNDRGIVSVVSQIDPGRAEQEMVIEEMRRWPGWAGAPPVLHEPYYERLASEWNAASLVLVNSEWSRSALIKQGVPDRKLVVVPLAYEPPANLAPRRRRPDGPLRVLWLGQVVLRKGIQYLIEAARRLSPSEFRFDIVGPLGITAKALSSAPPNMAFVGRALREDVSHLYSSADVFVLPTLSDGFALTQLEAIAHGLPVIATPNCARVVTDGVDGVVVEPGNVESLVNALIWCRDNKSVLVTMGERARQKLSAYTLEAYADRLGAAYHSLRPIHSN